MKKENRFYAFLVTVVGVSLALLGALIVLNVLTAWNA